MDKIICKSFVEEIEEDGVIRVAVASDGIVDRQGEIIDPDGWFLETFKANPQFLWGHNISEYKPPIGKVKNVWFEGEGVNKKLMFTPQFDLKDEFAREIYRKYQDGFLNAFSVGAIPLERQGNTITRAELVEISAVAVPANPNALVQMKSAGMESVSWKDLNNAVKEENIEEDSKIEEDSATAEESVDIEIDNKEKILISLSLLSRSLDSNNLKKKGNK